MNTDWERPFRPLLAEGLPIFRQDHAAYALFYAPGYLAVVGRDQADTFESCLADPASDDPPAIADLRRFAARAQHTWDALRSRPFAPLCLTLYLNNRCNLACAYCFADATPDAAETLSLKVIRSAAEIVAANCRAQARPFTAVFHGGGEPSLDQSLVDSILDSLAQVAAAYGLSLFRYIATNGVMSERRAAWLAARFDRIGLSCDGPEAIQNRQRPLPGGQSSTPLVERTAQIIHEAGKPLHVRVTLTPESLHRQPDIAAYVCQKLKPQEIHVEVMYQGGRADPGFEADQAQDFVAAFLQAREVAHAFGVRWLTSGSRPAEIHGAYCNVFRDALNLVPGDVATACFKATHANQVRQQTLLVGELDNTGTFLLDLNHVHVLRQALRVESARCAACFNRYHCVRGCPDRCLLDSDTEPPTFRCRVQRLLTNACLQEAAARLWVTAHQSLPAVVCAIQPPICRPVTLPG